MFFSRRSILQTLVNKRSASVCQHQSSLLRINALDTSVFVSYIIADGWCNDTHREVKNSLSTYQKEIHPPLIWILRLFLNK